MALLSEVDVLLGRRIALVAVGGTALTLLDVKPSTIDIDFTGPAADIDEFSKAEKLIPHGFRIDKYKDGAVFTQILPDDYELIWKLNLRGSFEGERPQTNRLHASLNATGNDCQ